MVGGETPIRGSPPCPSMTPPPMIATWSPVAMMTPPQSYCASAATEVSVTAPDGSITTHALPYDLGFREAYTVTPVSMTSVWPPVSFS